MADDNEFLVDSDDEEAPKKRENSTIRQMRETLEQRETRLKELEERTARYESNFLESAGLTEKQANALRAAGYEASPQGIDSFRSEVLGVATEEPAAVEEPQAESDEVEAPAEASFAPTPTQGSSPPGKREVTSDELVELMKTDAAKAEKLLREGRIVRKAFNPGGPAF